MQKFTNVLCTYVCTHTTGHGIQFRFAQAGKQLKFCHAHPLYAPGKCAACGQVTGTADHHTACSSSCSAHCLQLTRAAISSQSCSSEAIVQLQGRYIPGCCRNTWLSIPACTKTVKSCQAMLAYGSIQILLLLRANPSSSITWPAPTLRVG